MTAGITMTQTENAADAKRLSLLLRRQIALQKESLMSDADELVQEHFEVISKRNCLKDAQLKNLEGVAFSAENPGEVVKFIRRQAAKDLLKKPDKQAWTHNQLNQKLEHKTTEITGRLPGKTTGPSGAKDDVIANVRAAAEEEPPVMEESLGKWSSKELELEIQLELLREFIAQFSVFYALKARTVSSNEEGED